MRPVLAATLVGTAALLGCSGPAATTAQEPPVSVTVTGGQGLPPGSYRASVTSDGKPVGLTIVTTSPIGASAGGGGGSTAAPPRSGAAAPGTAAPGTAAPGSTAAGTAAGGAPGAAAPGTAADDSGPGIGTLLLVVAVVLVLAVGGVLLYLRVLAPRRFVPAYRRAVAQMEVQRYDLALPALTGIEARLPDRVRAEARFFIAYALYRQDDPRAAEYRLTELHRETPGNVEVAHLLAHLLAERRDVDGAETVLETVDPERRTADRKLRRLYGLVKVSRAFAAYREGRIDAAAELFEEVERLGDFAGLVPIDLRNRNVMVGTRALFDRDVPAAREQFEALGRAARQAEEPQRTAMLASADLGLALGAWIGTDDDAAAQTERLLVRALWLLDPDGALTARWPDSAQTPGQTDRVAAMMDRTDRPKDAAERDRTVRDVHFLRGMAVLRGRAEADRRDGVDGDAGDDRFVEEALGRFARARELDPEFSDVHVVVGLLRFYLSTDDAERRAAVAVLREAQNLGTRDPEVLQILNRDDRDRQAGRDAADRFLQVLDRYVQDVTVRTEVREALLARMSRHSRVRDWDTRPDLSRGRVVAPTVEEVRARSELLRERVADLLRSRTGGPDLAGARDLTASLEERSRAMAESARAVEEQEAALLALLGDRLLSEVDR